MPPPPSVLDFISIHAPRGGSDDPGKDIVRDRRYFNPRSPWGERPEYRGADRQIADFNPRSPWGERLRSPRFPRRWNYFNPRSPWGERPEAGHMVGVAQRFQSTLPVGGATLTMLVLSGCTKKFQSTLPVGGATLDGGPKLWVERLFQSTLPVGGATNALANKPITRIISIHAPRGGSDFVVVYRGEVVGIESRAPRGGGDRDLLVRSRIFPHFNPRSPWGERHPSEKPHP